MEIAVHELPSDPIELLIAFLREEKGPIFASLEDASYFRKAYKMNDVKTNAPKQETVLPPPTKLSPPLRVDPIATLPSPPKLAVEQTARDSLPGPDQKSQSEALFSLQEEASLPSEGKKRGDDFPSIRKILSLVAPDLVILSDIPNDQMARKIAARWKTKNQGAPISILLFQEPLEQKELLEQIARAIDTYFGPAKIVQAETIEKEKQWATFLSIEGLKTILVCDYTLWQLHSLMQFYKETPAQGIRTLGNIPVFLLPDLSLYLKDPSLKRSLWKALCQKFS